jgi:hypothetical protein
VAALHKTLVQLDSLSAVKNIPPDVAVAMIRQVVPDVVRRLRELGRERLLDLMLAAARKYMGSDDWVQGMEFTLWRAVVEGPEQMDATEVDELKDLAEEFGGWFYRFGDDPNFDPNAATEEDLRPSFYTLEHWKLQYDQYVAKTVTVDEQNARLRRRVEELERELARYKTESEDEDPEQENED